MTKPKRCTWRPRHRSLDDLYAGREHHEVSCKQNFITFIPPLDITFCPYCGVKIEEGEPIPQKPPGPPDPSPGGYMPRWGDDTEQPKPLQSIPQTERTNDQSKKT